MSNKEKEKECRKAKKRTKSSRRFLSNKEECERTETGQEGSATKETNGLKEKDNMWTEKKNKIGKTTKEWEEIFAGLPELKRVFGYYARQIRFYNCYEWEEGMAKERLIRKRDLLLEVAKRIGNKDLFILYCIHDLRGISAECIC